MPAILLGFFTSAGLAAIDFYYSGKNVISPVYALDGIAEVLFAPGPDLPAAEPPEAAKGLKC